MDDNTRAAIESSAISFAISCAIIFCIFFISNCCKSGKIAETPVHLSNDRVRIEAINLEKIKEENKKLGLSQKQLQTEDFMVIRKDALPNLEKKE